MQRFLSLFYTVKPPDAPTTPPTPEKPQKKQERTDMTQTAGDEVPSKTPTRRATKKTAGSREAPKKEAASSEAQKRKKPTGLSAEAVKKKTNLSKEVAGSVKKKTNLSKEVARKATKDSGTSPTVEKQNKPDIVVESSTKESTPQPSPAKTQTASDGMTNSGYGVVNAPSMPGNEPAATGDGVTQPSAEQTGVQIEQPEKKESKTANSRRKIMAVANDLSGRARKVMRFISRPIKERDYAKFMRKVEKRRKRRENSVSSDTQAKLKTGDDEFPAGKESIDAESVIKGLQRQQKKAEYDEEIAKIFPDLSKEPPAAAVGGGTPVATPKKPVKKTAEDAKPKTASVRKKPKVVKNKDNNGEVMINGRPWWVGGEKISDVEKEEITADDLPLTAEVLLQVRQGIIDLPLMPDMKVILDPYQPLAALTARDAVLFTHGVLFGNTVRTMFNLADDTLTDPETTTERTKRDKKAAASREGVVVEKPPPPEPEPAVVTLAPEPTTYIRYRRGDVAKTRVDRPYKRTGRGLK